MGENDQTTINISFRKTSLFKLFLWTRGTNFWQLWQNIFRREATKIYIIAQNDLKWFFHWEKSSNCFSGQEERSFDNPAEKMSRQEFLPSNSELVRITILLERESKKCSVEYVKGSFDKPAGISSDKKPHKFSSMSERDGQNLFH